MKISSLLFTTLLTFNLFAQLPFQKVRTYETGIFDDGDTEIVAFDRQTNRLFSTNGSQNRLDILDYSDIAKPFLVKSVNLSQYIANVNSVDVVPGLVAVVGGTSSPQSLGKILFFDQTGKFLNQFNTGVTPDMVKFALNGSRVLVANEGEPSNDYASDPRGSVSILDISSGVMNTTTATISKVEFQLLDSTFYDPLIRVFGDSGRSLPSQDLEPEFIALNSNETKAYVTLQENNAVAIIDIVSATLDTVIGLGYKNWGGGDSLDVSDVSDSIEFQTIPNLFGMYQPDGIAGFTANGQDYFATANEGEPRDYLGYSEVARVGSLILDANDFPNPFFLQQDTALGRLKVTTTLGNSDGDILYDWLFTFGARSFSIWDSAMQLVWDSGDDFEQITAQLFRTEFNSNNVDNNSYKSRSDDQGSEPEGVTVGEVDGVTYAFIGLEQMGGIMIYDVSDPQNPTFIMYELNRDFSVPADDPMAGDLGPEGLEFVPANQSPTGFALLFVANEVSGTITVYEMGSGIGLDENSVEHFGVFPNPSDGKFSTVEKGSFSVYNSNGKIVQKVINKNEVDLSNELTGYYVIRDEKGNAVRVLKR